MENSEVKDGKKVYEGMFILKASSAGKDWAKVSGDVRKLIESHGAEVVLMDKWDECKLAYDIKKQNKGVYLLAYFKMPPSEVSPLKREVELSSVILRMLLLNCKGPVEGKTIKRPVSDEGIPERGPAREARRDGEDAGDDAPGKGRHGRLPGVLDDPERV